MGQQKAAVNVNGPSELVCTALSRRGAVPVARWPERDPLRSVYHHQAVS